MKKWLLLLLSLGISTNIPLTNAMEISSGEESEEESSGEDEDIATDADVDLVEAVIEGDTQKVKDSINQGAIVNRYKYNPLAYALQNQDLDLVKFLVSKGATIDTPVAGKLTLQRIAENTAGENELFFFSIVPLLKLNVKGFSSTHHGF
ncbi:MAG: Ankyrin repeats (3 copies) [Candidatus Dependentiae bacterium ADurb.Bin331]|nr:MAG: Ankyrin repeats (3 copies) [Candidatus Dependentiae bacterium ADurb.Bin331]